MMFLMQPRVLLTFLTDLVGTLPLTDHQLVFVPGSSASFVYKDVMVDSIQSLAKVKINNIHSSPIICQASHLIECYHQACFPLCKSTLPTTFFSITHVETISRIICSITFPGIRVRLTGPVSQILLLAFLEDSSDIFHFQSSFSCLYPSHSLAYFHFLSSNPQEPLPVTKTF